MIQAPCHAASCPPRVASGGDGGQSRFAPRDLGGQVRAVVERARIGAFGEFQQLMHFLAPLRLDPLGVLPRQRFVLARVGRDLGAVQRDRTQTQAFHLARHQQHLHKQMLDRRQKAAPEMRDAVVIGIGVRRDETERHRVVTGALDLAGCLVRDQIDAPIYRCRA